jgi:beta-phosphoglucomutase
MQSAVLSVDTRNRYPCLRAVIFDMDGVIVDSHPAHRKAWRQFLRTFGREVSEAELDFILDGRKRADILRHFLGELSEVEILDYGKRKDDFFRDSFSKVNVFRGVTELLDELSSNGIATAVATSASENRTRSTLDRLHLTKRFSVIVTEGDVIHGKPDPAVYRLACRRLGVASKHALAIEDAASGIQAAKAANLACVGVANRDRSKMLTAAGADHVLENFVGVSVDKLEAVLRRRAMPKKLV